MKLKNTFKLLVRLYGWKLIFIIVALAMIFLTKTNFVTAEAELPPGSVPTPDINPL